MAENQGGAATVVAEEGKIAAALLKLVRRPVVKDGKVVLEGTGEKAAPKLRAVRPDEVLSWRDYEDRVVVVTVDGQKLVGDKNAQ